MSKVYFDITLDHDEMGHAHDEAERLHPSHYDYEGQNVGEEHVGVELDGVWQDAGDLSLTNNAISGGSSGSSPAQFEPRCI